MGGGEKADLPQTPESAYSAKHVKNGKSAGQSGMRQPPIRCPECGSDRIWKDGLRYLNDGRTVQRFLCRGCGFRFSQGSLNPCVKFNIISQTLEGSNPRKDLAELSILDVNFPNDKAVENSSLPFCKDVGSHSKPIATIVEKDLNTLCHYDRECRVCAKEIEAKNLAEVESRTEKRAAGATTQGAAEGKLIEFLWWMQKQGYRESTTVSRGSRLRRLVKLGADLFNPESVKEVIAAQKSWSEARKEAMVYTYDLWAKWLGIKWEKPLYKAPRKLPFIPLEREIDDLIAACNKYVATFLQVAKETGARAGEIFSLKWTDIDFENRTINITPEKGSDPRLFKISNKLITMLNSLPRKHEQIFKHYQKLNYLRRSFDRYRKRAAHKLGNPRILKITFHTLRHWKATMEYHKTKDILYVMKFLGHRNIKNTLLYTQLVKQDGDEEYMSKVARTIDEARMLVEAGFEYVCDVEGVKLFRKRK